MHAVVGSTGILVAPTMVDMEFKYRTGAAVVGSRETGTNTPHMLLHNKTIRIRAASYVSSRVGVHTSLLAPGNANLVDVCVSKHMIFPRFSL